MLCCTKSELLKVAAPHKEAPQARKCCSAVLYSLAHEGPFSGTAVQSNMLNMSKSTSVNLDGLLHTEMIYPFN